MDAAAQGRGWGRGGRRCRRRPSRQARRKTQARAAHLPGRQLRLAHGSALQPHRRYAARLPVLGGQRSAEKHLRRHRLDLRRTRQRAGVARHRPQGIGGRHGQASGTGAGPRRRRRHGRDFPDQSQCRQRARHPALSIPQRDLRYRRGALRSRRPQVQPRQLHRAQGGRRRPRESRRRTRRAGIRRGHRARR